MLYWLTLVVALLGPAILLYTGMSMVRRLERLDTAVRRVRASQAEAQSMQATLTRLTERLAAMGGAVPAIRRRSAAEPPPGVSAAPGVSPPDEPLPAGLPQATAAPDGRNRGDRHGLFGRIER